MKRRNLYLYIGFSIIIILLLLFVVSIFYTSADAGKMNAAEKFTSPNSKYIMGTDNFGRDVFRRVTGGLQVTFIIALATIAIGAVVGTFIGAFTGYFGGWLDEIIMRMNDALLAFPSILLALVFVSVLGTGKYNIIIALGIVFIPSFARVARSEVIKYKNLDYVKSAKLIGASSFRIMFLHILPNAMPTLLASIAVGFNNAVLAEAGMSYLGIGVQPPDASLGRMLSESQGYLFTAPWCVIFPGLAIILMSVGFVFLSNGLNKRVEYHSLALHTNNDRNLTSGRLS